jgi:hypothetical protein
MPTTLAQLSAELDALTAKLGMLQAAAIPVGHTTISESQLAEIERLCQNPSKNAYIGSNEYDEEIVHQNWIKCTERLAGIRDVLQERKLQIEDASLENQAL